MNTTERGDDDLSALPLFAAPVEVISSRANPQTSIDAWLSNPRTHQESLVEDFFRSRGDYGAIAEEADIFYGNEPRFMWRRIPEMRRKGILAFHPEGLTRPTTLGSDGAVHVWVEPALRVPVTTMRKGRLAYDLLRRHTDAVLKAWEEDFEAVIPRGSMLDTALRSLTEVYDQLPEVE